MSLKRRIYGLPVMRFYREWRTSQLALRSEDTGLGFSFAGHPTYFREDWEAKERQALLAELSCADVFIDVGANQGIYSCLAATSGVRVVAVEPEAGNLRFLMANLAQFLGVEIYPLAISNKAGILSLYGDGDTASLNAGWLGIPRSFRQSVPVNTLDALFAHRWKGQRLLIKVDVEGAETDVLAGATLLLEQEPKPVWLIESFSKGGLDQLNLAGYDIIPISNGNFLCKPLGTVRIEEANSEATKDF